MVHSETGHSSWTHSWAQVSLVSPGSLGFNTKYTFNVKCHTSAGLTLCFHTIYRLLIRMLIMCVIKAVSLQLLGEDMCLHIFRYNLHLASIMKLNRFLLRHVMLHGAILGRWSLLCHVTSTQHEHSTFSVKL